MHYNNSTTPRPADSIFSESLGRAVANQRLRGRKLLIVGGRQHGRAISILCAREGASVVVLDANQEAAESTVAQIRAENPSVLAESYQLDVRDVSGIAAAVDHAKKTLSGLDSLVLVVGISKGLSLARMSAEAWDDDFAVDVRSHMLFAQRAMEVMEIGGAVVVLSSLASITAGSGNPAYEASKAAQLALVRSVARVGEMKGIRFNGIAPGYVDTPMGRDASRKQKNRAQKVPFGRQGTGY